MRVGLAEVDDDRPPLEPLHRAGDQVAPLILELVEEAVALGLADLLDDHLLGRLGRDPAELGGVHLDPVLGRVDRPGVAVDVDLDLGRIGIVLAGRRGERRLDPIEQDILGDILVAVDAVDDPDQIDAHSNSSEACHPFKPLDESRIATRRPGRKERRAAPGRTGGARSSCRDAIEQSNASLDLTLARGRPHGADRAQRTNQAPKEPNLPRHDWQGRPKA